MLVLYAVIFCSTPLHSTLAKVFALLIFITAYGLKFYFTQRGNCEFLVEKRSHKQSLEEMHFSFHLRYFACHANHCFPAPKVCKPSLLNTPCSPLPELSMCSCAWIQFSGYYISPPSFCISLLLVLTVILFFYF